MSLLFSDDDLEMFHRVRRAWNSRELLNPGKVLPSARTCAEFKKGSDLNSMGALPEAAPGAAVAES